MINSLTAAELPSTDKPERAGEPALRLLLRRAAGALCLGLGCVVLSGWYTHTTSLLRICPAFVAMAYNTAFGFFLSGLGILTSSSSQRSARTLTGIGGAGGLLIDGLTLGEYLLHVSFGIDQLLMHAYIRSGVTAPGRMAFCAALCFSLCGLSLLLVQGRRFSARPLFLSAFASVITGLGIVALSGYLTGIVQSYVWGQFTRMAVHTAAGFVVLGLGLLTLAVRDGQAPGMGQAPGKGEAQSTPGWLPIFTGVMAAAVTLCLWQALVVEESTQAGLIRRLVASSRLSSPPTVFL